MILKDEIALLLLFSILRSGILFVDGIKLDGKTVKRAKRQLAALTQSANFSDAGPGPELVMSCDINEGSYNQEDALVLNLRFADDSNNVVQSLKQQQEQIATQINEIWVLFKQMHKEQARMLQLQNALRQQNAQIVALYGNIMKNKLDTQSPGFIEDIFDIRGVPDEEKREDDRPADDTKTPRSGHVTRAASPERDVISEDKNIVEKSRKFDNVSITARSTIHSDNPVIEPDIIVPSDYASENTDDVVFETDELMCLLCNDEEYCVVEEETAQCYPCTECSPGYEMTSHCTKYRDIICGDINECSLHESGSICLENSAQCVNTPGGYLCLGGDASCIDGYYFNRRASQCEPCTACPSRQHIIVPCSKFSDSICRTDDTEQQTDVWTGGLRKPNKILKAVSELSEGYSLLFSDTSKNNQTVLEIAKNRRRSKPSSDSSLRRDASNSLKLLRHGVMWMEYNIALMHSCRSYIQSSIFISTASPESSSNGAVMGRGQTRMLQSNPEMKALAAARIEHSSGDRYKFMSLAAVAETEPGHEIRVELKSAHSGCVTTPSGEDRYSLRTIAPSTKSGPFSILWLSHDTGSVAFRASTKMTRTSTSLYAEFVQDYASDLHVVQLSHSGRYFQFQEPGIILAKYHQALYSIGESCIEQGYSMTCNLERVDGESGEALVRAHKSGVSYTDTSMSMTLMTSVGVGDRMALDLIAPARCQMRYMSDLNLGVVNLLWIPRQSSAGLLARLDHRDEITGSVRSKVLSFVASQNTNPEKIMVRSSSYFEFKMAGRIYVSYSTRAIHSCDYLKAAIHYVSDSSGSANSEEIAQQVLGDTDGRWDGISLGTSHTAEVGSMCYITITCVRGRIDRMSYGEWSTLSILWVPL